MSDCSLFPNCGGCTYRDLSYTEQLKKKKAEVKGLLAPVIGGDESFDDLFEDIFASPCETGYRNKMEYSFGDAEKGGPLTLGLHRKGSRYDVLTADDCRIVHEDFNRIVQETLRLCRAAGLSYYRKRDHVGYLRHLLIRRSLAGEILVDLVTSSQWSGSQREETWLSDFAATISALPLEGEVTGILHTTNDSPADTIKDEHTDILCGRDYITEEVLGLTFRITTFSFFQTNTRGAELLYTKGREYLGDVSGTTIFDLYSGTGTIAQVLAPVAKEVIGVEIVEEAVEAARGNAEGNGLANCRFIAGDVWKVVDTLPEKPEVIVLDPPREGIHPKAMPKILAFGAGRILYISCKPASLARDLPLLLEAGYQVEKLCCVDLFPATKHIETVVLMSRGKD